MQSTKYSSIKIIESYPSKLEDALVIEGPLQININKEAYTVVMRTPGDDYELIRGLLFAEDIYKDSEKITSKVISNEKFATEVNMIIPIEKLRKGYLNKRTLLSVSSCGICGKKELEDIAIEGETLKSTVQFSPKEIKKMFVLMLNAQNTFHLSGGSHACAIFNKKQELLTIKEDIGRHNAVDKCVGDLLIKNNLKAGKIMLVSGRVSYEIVSKAFFAKIPIIVAVSACSSLAVDYAKEFGICLIGFHRDNKMTIYANPQYISYEKENQRTTA